MTIETGPIATDIPLPRSAARRYGVLLRAALGLCILAVLTIGGAALMYASIEPGHEFARDADAAARHATLAKIRKWHDIEASNLATAGSTGAGEMLVIDAAVLNGLKLSTAQKQLLAMQTGDAGQSRLVLATVTVPVTEAARSLFGTEEALVDQVVARGGDGIIIDAAAAMRVAMADGAPAEVALVQMFAQLGLHARALNPNFLIVLRNAAALTVHEPVLRTIDGLVEDNLLYGLDGPGRRNGLAEVGAALHDLNRARTADRVVFIVEYLSQSNTGGRQRVKDELTALKFVPVLPMTRPARL